MLKDKGVFVYALGIGKGVNRAQLEQIATNSRGVFIATSFEQLKPIIQVIIDSVCRDGKWECVCFISYSTATAG